MDMVFLALILWVSKKNPNKTFTEILDGFWGKKPTRVVNFVLFIAFLLRAIFIINEYHTYLLETLFTFLPWPFYIIPLILLLAYIVNKSLRSMGRSVEVLIILILTGLILTLFIPIEYVEISNIFPVLEDGFGPIFTAAFYCSFSVGDFFVFVVLLGKFKVEKNSHIKLFNYALFANVLILVFYVIFFAVFGITATNQSLAIGDLPLFASFPSSVGRIDWITINLWSITAIFQAGVFLSFGLECFNTCFSVKGKYVGVVVIMILVLGALQATYSNIPVIVDIVTHPVFASINFATQAGIASLMVLATLLALKKNKRSNYVRYHQKIYTE